MLPQEVRVALEADGKDWGDYVLIRCVGVGGMGEVFRAWEKSLGRIVAIKLLKEITPEAVARFEREARLAARLKHPQIATMYGMGEHDGRRYLAMEFIEGTTLQESGAELPVQLAAVEDVARAVNYAHSHGVIHRDINPRNIMLDTLGKGFVTDFGIARYLTAGSTVTQTGMVLGTPAYMSPEQARGDIVDSLTDVYSLGASLYFAVTQSAPFYGDAPLEILRHVRDEEPVAPRKLNPKIDGTLEDIIEHAMQKEPAARYPSANDLAAELRRYRRTGKIRGRPWRARMRPRPQMRRRWTAVGAMTAAVAVGALLWWATHPTDPPVQPRPPVPELEQADATIDWLARLPNPTPSDVTEAESQLEVVLGRAEQKDPSRAQLKWGKFFWVVNNRNEALSRIDRSIAADQENGIAYLWRARILLRQYLQLRVHWEFTVSLPTLLDLLISPQSDTVRDMARMSNLVTEGSDALNRFQELTPESSAETKFANGVQSFYKSENEQAEQALVGATRSSYLSRDAYLMLGIVQTFLMKYDAAEESLRQARSEGEDYLLVRAMLALRLLVDFTRDPQAKLKQKRKQALEAHLRVLLDADPEPANWDWLNQSAPLIRREMNKWIRDVKRS